MDRGEPESISVAQRLLPQNRNAGKTADIQNEWNSDLVTPTSWVINHISVSLSSPLLAIRLVLMGADQVLRDSGSAQLRSKIFCNCLRQMRARSRWKSKIFWENCNDLRSSRFMNSLIIPYWQPFCLVQNRVLRKWPTPKSSSFGELNTN